MHGGLKLYSYWRSSASFRVRIALNLKGLDYELHPVNLINGAGDQHGSDYRFINPQGLVPVLKHGERVIRQSLAIIEFIEECFDGPALLPATGRERARARSLAQLIACEAQPLINLRVQQYLGRELGLSEAARDQWVQHWLRLASADLEALLNDNPSTGEFAEGDFATIADCILVPHVYSCQRFGVAMDDYPTVMRIYDTCKVLDEFQRAWPENQPDAPQA